MVGNTDYKTEEKYAKVLAKYFDQDNTVFVISSDFCHWGKRFQFTYYK
jgi:predicted class III extradiol MEMO1 family dioxygenase